jgi:CHRD domain-containing protein
MIHRRHFLWSSILLIGVITLVGCGSSSNNSTPAPTPGAPVTKLATIDGSQEATPVTTSANGAGSLTVDTGTGAVSGSLTILAAPATTVTAAHVHDAAAGNAVIIPLSDSGGGVWSVPATATALTPAQIASFTAGTLYFNVHTTANPGGEMRGNINKAAATLYARMDGAQESPPVTTTAAGTGSLTVDASTGIPSGSLTITVAPATAVTAAHVHDAAAGNAVIIPLSDSGGGVWSVPATAKPLTVAQIASFIGGKLYFNAHTTTNPGGEIRGNIILIAP